MYVTKHAREQAEAKGFTLAQVIAAAEHPTVTYPNGRFPGQHRHIRDGVVAVVKRDAGVVVTVYANIKETAPRIDQLKARGLTGKDARAYARKYGAL